MQFRLTKPALRDAAEIMTYQHSRHSASAADSLETRLFQLFADLANSPPMGHRRSDLTSKDVMFHYAKPYFILFRQLKMGTQELRVAHESRDLRKFL